MRKWTKYPYGKQLNSETNEWEHDGGHWTLTNGHISFDVHVSFDGSGRKEEYPDGVIVSPAQAYEYAEKVLAALNKCEVDLK